jgi:hypothetical protein
VAAAETAAPDTANPTTIELQDPQPGGSFPPLTPLDDDQPLLTISQLQAPPRELSESPMAPLPPAVVAGPLTIAIASWLAAWIVDRRW